MRRPTLVRNSIQGSALWAMSEEEEEPVIPPPGPDPLECRFCGKQVYDVEEVQTRRQKDNFKAKQPFLCSLDCANALNNTRKGKGPPVILTANPHGGPYGRGKATNGGKDKSGKGGKPSMHPKGGKGYDEFSAREQTHAHGMEMVQTILGAVLQHFGPKQ